MSAASREIVPTGADDRVHNSGYGRPPELYRTPLVGGRFTVNMARILPAWDGAASRDAIAICEGWVELRPPTDAIARYAVSVARALGDTALDAGADAITALRSVCRQVEERGLVEGIVFTASTYERYKVESRNAPRIGKIKDQQVALVLALLACASPPLVLWGREPSLEYFTRKYVMHVSWLQRSLAGPPARAAWQELETRWRAGS